MVNNVRFHQQGESTHDRTRVGQPFLSLFAVGGNKTNKQTGHWCCLKGVLKPWVEVLNEAGSVREIFI